jgi:glycosyltransferase involved in cell wall biosynthesis
MESINNQLKIMLVNDSTNEIGGAETYILTFNKILESKGHSTFLFGPKNDVGLSNSFFSRWYSRKYYKEITDKIRKFNPDIVHVHNLSRVISPSVLRATYKASVPIIQTVHDYHYICPKVWMLDRNGEIIRDHSSNFDCIFNHQPKKNIIYTLSKHLKAQFHKI